MAESRTLKSASFPLRRAGRISVGTTVFGARLAATTLNLLFIPVLYVIVRSVVPGRETPTATRAGQ
jgi:hypothetical protein